MTYDNPDYLQPEKNKPFHPIRSLKYEEGKTNWRLPCFCTKERLKAALTKTRFEVTVKIEQKSMNPKNFTIVAMKRK